MDDSQPGRGDLTVEQWQQRCDWARRMWESPWGSAQWSVMNSCISVARAQGHKAPLVPSFTQPQMYPEFINAVFEEYAKRKLLGEAP